MATFNQQNQNVQHQINADTVHVRGSMPEVTAMIDDLMSKVGTRKEVAAHLRDARAASDRGDRSRMLAMLTKAAAVAGPVAAITSGIATIMEAVR